MLAPQLLRLGVLLFVWHSHAPGAAGALLDLHSLPEVRVHSQYGLLVSTNSTHQQVTLEPASSARASAWRVCVHFLDARRGSLRATGEHLTWRDMRAGILESAPRCVHWYAPDSSSTSAWQLCPGGVDCRAAGNESLGQTLRLDLRALALHSAQVWQVGGAGSRWNFTRCVCPSEGCFTAVEAKVQLHERYNVRVLNRTYRPVWSFNKNQTSHGYFRRTPYDAEGGIAFASRVKAREDKLGQLCYASNPAHTATLKGAVLRRGWDNTTLCTCAPGEQRGAEVCEECPAGKYSPAQNNLQCDECAVGQYSTAPGKTTCTQCPPAMPATIGRGSTQKDECVHCDEIAQKENAPMCSCEDPALPVFNSTTKNCSACPSGHEFDGQHNRCRQCEAGTELSAFKCTQCLHRTYAPQNATANCLTCPNGKDIIQYRGASDADACTTCPPHTFRVDGQCFPCARRPAADAGSNATTCRCAGGFESQIVAFSARESRTLQAVQELKNYPCFVSMNTMGKDSERTLVFTQRDRRAEFDGVGLVLLYSPSMANPKTLNLEEEYSTQFFWDEKTQQVLAYEFKVNTVTRRTYSDALEPLTTTPAGSFEAVGLASAHALQFELDNGRLLKKPDCTQEWTCSSLLRGRSVHKRMYAAPDGTRVALVLNGSTLLLLNTGECPTTNSAPGVEIEESVPGNIHDVQYTADNEQLIVSYAGAGVVLLESNATARTLRNASTAHASACRASMSSVSLARLQFLLHGVHAIFEHGPDVGSGPLCAPCTAGKARAHADARTRCAACNATAIAAAAAASTCSQCAYGEKSSTDRTQCETDTECLQPVYTLVPAERLQKCACPSAHSPQYAADGGATCMPCAAGTFKARRGNENCTACGAGNTSRPGSASAHDCYPAECEHALGVFFNKSTHEGRCSCPPGAYMATLSAGNHTCTQCPADTWQGSASRNDSCHACGQGTGLGTRGAQGQTSFAACVCAAGKQFESGKSACDWCPLGTFGAALNATQRCTPCTGETLTTSRRGASNSTQCKTCEPGFFYNKSDDGTGCSRCPPGSGFNSSRQACSVCRAHDFGPTDDGTGVCAPCPNATWATAGASSATQCVRCAGGAGWSDNAMQCVTCPRGHYSDNSTGRCQPCTRGRTSFQGSPLCMCQLEQVLQEGTCARCTAGTDLVKTENGTFECINCSAVSCPTDAECATPSYSVNIDLQTAYNVSDISALAQMLSVLSDVCSQHISVENLGDFRYRATLKTQSADSGVEIAQLINKTRTTVLAYPGAAIRTLSPTASVSGDGGGADGGGAGGLAAAGAVVVLLLGAGFAGYMYTKKSTPHQGTVDVNFTHIVPCAVYHMVPVKFLHEAS